MSAKITIKEVYNGFVVEFENLQKNFRREEIFTSFEDVVERLNTVKKIDDITKVN